MESTGHEINLDVKKICRTCMQGGEMTDLYYNCDKQCCLIEKLMYCTFLSILPDDGLPSQICSNCMTLINLSYNFAKKCEDVQKILQDHFIYDKKLKNSNSNDKCTVKLTANEVTPPYEAVTIDESSSDDNFEVNFDPLVYTDHTYDKNTSKLIIKHKTIEENTEHLLENKSAPETIKQTTKTKTGPPYVCKRCNEQFPVYYQLKEHFKIAKHSRNEYTHRSCPICSKVVSYSHLNHHLRTHTLEKPFCCEFCGKRFSLSGNLVRHKRVHSGEKPYKCDICNKSFSQSTRMKDHRRIHTGEKAYVCNICGKTFSQFANFRHHMKRHEKEITEENEDSTKDSTGVTRPRKSKQPVDFTIKCDVCDQIFRSARSLKTHLVTHEVKKFNCADCGRGFTHLHRLQNHYKSHSADRPFGCHICEKSFTMKSSLKSHMFIHSGEKPYPCNYCEKAFVQLGQLKYHLRIHTGERPYACTVCGKRFTLNGNLTVHMRTHTGETPYMCPVCNKGFYDSSSMKKHQKAHTSDPQIIC